MGGGLCRPSDVFAASLPLAISTALPINRSFLHSACLSPDVDPWLAADVQSFLQPALSGALALPQEKRRQQAFAQSLFTRYHHSHTLTLSQPQLAALMHDYLTATAVYAPQLVAAVMADSHRQLLTLVAHQRSATPLTRDERRRIESHIRQAEADINQLTAQWLTSLRQREGQLVKEVWERLAEKGKAAGGVTEAVFTEWWHTVSDDVMAMQQFQMHVPSLLYDDVDMDGGEKGEEGRDEYKDRDARHRGVSDDSERAGDSKTVVEVITVEESLRMRHGSISESRPNEPPIE